MRGKTLEIESWKNATPLQHACQTFCSAETRDALKDHSQETVLAHMSADTLEIGKTLSGLAFMRISNERLKLHNAARQASIRETLDRLARGELVACGFEAPRKLDSRPILLSPAMFEGYIAWDKGTLSHEGLQFVEVRLAETSAHPPALKAPGRPTIKHAIEEAFRALQDAGEIDPNKPAGTHYPKVRNWLRKHRTDLPKDPMSISNEGIRAHFSPLFNALRKNRKQ